jgi:histidine triad (HIT) family protein
MASIFTKIINREIPAHIVAENEDFIAFLDVNPLVAGHTLVVPKREVDYIFDLPESLLSDIMHFAHDVARKVEKTVPCKRIGVSVIGLEVPHTHINLIPMNSVSDMNFARPKLSIPASEMEALADKIRKA